MSINSSEDADDFEAALTEIMYRIEGIAHFTIDQFYNFDYLSPFVSLYNPSVDTTVNEWFSVFRGYNNQMIEQLVLCQTKIASVGGKADLKTYLKTRVSFSGSFSIVSDQLFFSSILFLRTDSLNWEIK